MIQMSMDDAITPYVTAWLKDHPRFISSLTKSLGWVTQKSIKQLVDDSGFTSKWGERMPYAKRRKLEARWGKRTSRKWMGRMKTAIGYQYDPATTSVSVGWLSMSAADLGERFEEGGGVKTTPKLRRYFALRGMVVSKGKEFMERPARPLFTPAMKIIQPGYKDYIEGKIAKYIQNQGFKKNSGSGRKYQVFG